MSALIIFCWHCPLYHLAVNNGALLRGFKTSGSRWCFWYPTSIVFSTAHTNMVSWYRFLIFPKGVYKNQYNNSSDANKMKTLDHVYVTRFSMAVRISLGKCCLKLQGINMKRGGQTMFAWHRYTSFRIRISIAVFPCLTIYGSNKLHL